MTWIRNKKIFKKSYESSHYLFLHMYMYLHILRLILIIYTVWIIKTFLFLIFSVCKSHNRIKFDWKFRQRSRAVIAIGLESRNTLRFWCLGKTFVSLESFCNNTLMNCRKTAYSSGILLSDKMIDFVWPYMPTATSSDWHR